jgi:SNF2 family DNA or RNA helicase
MADRTLVVVPAGLVEQWVEELDRKFGIPTQVFDASGRTDSPTDGAVLVASLATARRQPSQSRLTQDIWDLVIFDEAHRVRNARTASGGLARAIRSRYLLLLTATPVENRLDDLFQLVNLAAPGLLGTPEQFRTRHGRPAASSGLAAARDVPALQRKVREVMVRHRRSEVAVTLPSRVAETRLVVPGPTESKLYAVVSARLRQEGRGAPPSRLLTLRSLARLAGSSPAALVAGLARMEWCDLADQAAPHDTPRKTEVLLELLQEALAANHKVVVFSTFRATLQHLADAAAASGVGAVVYHGGLTRADKESAIATFRDEAPVLLTTEAAGEGRNLQFCHVMVNYDLPWNPMQIEQRLGRLHRIGQDHEVVLTNLANAGTIEARILRTLETKINLFELVVGELDMILGHVEEDFDFETRVFTEYLDASDDEDFERRLDLLGDRLANARTAYLASRAAIDDLLEEAT